MTRLVLILLLANALMFGWNRGWFDGAGGAVGGHAEENPHRLLPVPLSRLDPPESERGSAALPASTTSTPQQAQPAQQRAAPAAPASSPPTQAPSAGSQAPQPPTASAPTAPGTTMPGPTLLEPKGPGAQTPAETGAAQSPAIAPAQSPVPAETPAPVQSPAPESGVSASVASVAAACRAFPPIDEERATALRSALEQSGARVEARRIEQGSSYLVYLPPASSVSETQQRLVELRRIGRDDAFVIQDGPMRLAISLGLFRFESAARAMVDQLARAGETRAMVVPRPPIQVRIALQARWSEPGGGAIAAMLGAQFDAPARDCD